MSSDSQCSTKEKKAFLKLSSSSNDYKEGIKMSRKFYELLCAKFCHDMAGAIGAINNGIDFIESDDTKMKEMALNLLKTSSKKAISSLTLLRQAYGFVPKESEVSFYSMQTLICNFLKETKVNCEILKSTKGDVEGWISKLTYNLVIMVSAFMMNEGDLKIEIGEDIITITSAAPMHKVDEGLENLFNESADFSELTTRNIQIAYTSLIANELGYKIEMDSTKPNILAITLKKSQ